VISFFLAVGDATRVMFLNRRDRPALNGARSAWRVKRDALGHWYPSKPGIGDLVDAFSGQKTPFQRLSSSRQAGRPRREYW
jgi:hypothetical protein